MRFARGEAEAVGMDELRRAVACGHGLCVGFARGAKKLNRNSQPTLIQLAGWGVPILLRTYPHISLNTISCVGFRLTVYRRIC